MVPGGFRLSKGINWSDSKRGSMESGHDTELLAENNRYLTSLAGGTVDSRAFDALFDAAQGELSKLAYGMMNKERGNHTLQPTALVNEAYLRLFDVQNLPVESRAHFVNLAARAMRQVLVEHARRHNADKRGGGIQAVTLTGAGVRDLRDEIGILELNNALEKLEELDPRAAEVVEKRIFGGLTMEEIADTLNLTRRTVQKDWRFALLWLRREFDGPGEVAHS